MQTSAGTLNPLVEFATEIVVDKPGTQYLTPDELLPVVDESYCNALQCIHDRL